ncbi:hypothetical protein SAMN04487857_102472 [Pseudomonas sp. ok272]|uniref:hypothetical protein n=1 Tax=unclassified Pseudomonas TaxID=196821 RepID=UPI0008CF364A|nr:MULTISPECIES: hypothetical protein [unclassified Pseudomonas]SEM53145.1 hypothetical protein SAMN04487857_102472 [Pseudomonas sp. ok272]SFM25008.1 hypothetical protein SAMN04487858_101474 [Pseudomonas sp. ok602]
MATPKPHEPDDVDDQAHEEEASEEENPPSQTWKHPDDGKELSERDQERPLKP